MCHEASRALVKSNKVKEAVDCCVALNQWDRAVEIAHEHNMLSVDELLAKYAAHLLEKGKWGGEGGGVSGEWGDEWRVVGEGGGGLLVS